MFDCLDTVVRLMRKTATKTGLSTTFHVIKKLSQTSQEKKTAHDQRAVESFFLWFASYFRRRTMPNEINPPNRRAVEPGSGTVTTTVTFEYVIPLSASPIVFDDPNVLLFAQKPSMPKLLAIPLVSDSVCSSISPPGLLIEL